MEGEAEDNQPEAPPEPTENKEEAFARRQAENEILRKAAILRDQIARAAKAEQRVESQLKRPKCHWDYLLAEMTWLAMDFAAERTWKAGTANNFARRAAAKGKQWQEAREKAAADKAAEEKKGPSKASAAAAAKDKAAKEKEAAREKAEKEKEKTPVPDLVAEATDGDSSLEPGDIVVYASFDDLAVAFEKLEEKHRTDEADYQQQLILWEHNERRRQRAVSELVRMQREEEEPREDLDGSPYDDDDRKGKRKAAAKFKAKPYAPVLREELQPRGHALHQLAVPNKRLRTSATQQAAARAQYTGRQLSSLPSSLADSQQDFQDPRWVGNQQKKKKKVDDDDLYNAKFDEDRRVGGFVSKRNQGNNRAGNKQAVAGNQRRAVAQQPVIVLIPWAPWEDELLKAIIREFCPTRPNWALVSDILISGSAMRGICRRWEHCKQRWEIIFPTVEPLEKEEDERARLARRQTLQRFLPADEETLKLHLERLIFVSGRIRSKKAAEKKEMAPSSAQRMMPSSSWTAALQHVVFRDPLEMAGSLTPYTRAAPQPPGGEVGGAPLHGYGGLPMR